MSELRILHLTLKKKWFDMIASGEKKEEYRDIKDYWTIRLGTKGWINAGTPTMSETYHFHKWDVIHFRHGYAENAPVVVVEHLGSIKGVSKPKWSDGAKECYILKLGRIIAITR